MKQVIRGTTVRVTGTFKDAGVLTDPTTVSLEVSDSAGTITTYTYAAAQITKTSTGIYYKNVAISSEGSWRVRMTGTGTVPVSTLETIECRSDVFV